MNTLIFSGDLSADRYSSIVYLHEGTKTVDIDIGWPATGTPVGTLTIQESLHGVAAGDWNNYSKDGTTSLTIAVAGTANVAHIRNLSLPGPRYMRLHYVRSSGGTGANFYDGGTVGNQPIAILTD
jgi:hypothetical protein